MSEEFDWQYKPLMVTLPQLQVVLLPLTEGYAWGQNTIHDLWILGAPTPDSTIQHEKRIILPSQLLAWLADVLNRRGEPLDEVAQSVVKQITGSEHVRRQPKPVG